MSIDPPIKRLALVVGGGPAPGINGVISAVTIEACNRGIEVFGIEDGYKWLANGHTMETLLQGIAKHKDSEKFDWLVRGDPNINPTHIVRLTKDDVRQIHNRGGSILRTSRTNPAKDPIQLQRVVDVLKMLKIDALVSIGGDDTCYTASEVYKAFKADTGSKLRVAHVPKTIDNDLPLPASTPTFGFETARHYGSDLVKNLTEDARTTSRWYVVVSMGRAAGHLALGVGKAAAATLTIIAEEFGLVKNVEKDTEKPRSIPIKHFFDIMVTTIAKRHVGGRSYGVIVIAEGLVESIKDELEKILEKTAGKYGAYKKDDFGHISLGEISFGNLIRDLLSERMMKEPTKDKPARLHELLNYPFRGSKIEKAFVSKDLGYELRCADPIPFDIEYTRDLGYSAVKFLHTADAAKFGAIIGFINGAMKPMDFEKEINPKTKRLPTRFVNTEGEGFQVALEYMIRLEKVDFDDADLIGKMADVLNMNAAEFRAEFGYLVGL